MLTTTTGSATSTGYRCGRRRDGTRIGGLSGLAAEHDGAYGPAPGGGSLAASDRVGAGHPEVPFGLPILAELPQLASVLHHLAAADRAQLAAVGELADLLRGDEVERTTGVGVDHWLAVVGQLTRMDRRLLVRTVRLLHRLPTLDAAVRAGRVSFAQLRGLALALRGARREVDEQVDRLLAASLDGLDRLERPDPDALVRQVADAVDELDPDDLAERERDASAGRFLALQPRLDGTGGRVNGELDAAGLALVDAATAPTPAQAADAGGVGPARADLLLARLAASEDGVQGAVAGRPRSRAPSGARPVDDPTVHGRTVHDPTVDGPAGGGGGSSWWGRLDPPKLLMRLQFETLLDPAVPAELLTALVGGRLKLTGQAARRVTEERGGLLRTVVVDELGDVIGVGRATRRPPGWLTDAELAVHDTCTEPGCDRPAATAQLDHATPWWPTRPDQPAGTTDVDNLGPLCATTNREKEAAGWQVSQAAGGVRTWRHLRSGLICTTVPSTWRPEDDPRRADRRHHGRQRERRRERHRRRSGGADPPGHHVPGLAQLPRDRPGDPSGDDLPF